jgi:hypothetical protein
MNINSKQTKAKHFAYDGCHKIYLIDDTLDKEEASDSGYDILPISKLRDTFEESCSLRFISDWKLKNQYVEQFEDALIEA